MAETNQPVIYVIQQPPPPVDPEEYEEEDDGAAGIAWVICFLLVLISLGTIILVGSPELQLWLQSVFLKLIS